jgi:hypothetical protein
MKGLNLGLYSVTEKEATVKLYPYRTARVKNKFLAINMDEFDESDKWVKRDCEKFLDNLCEITGKRLDNHTVYEIVYKDGSKYAVAYSDNNLYFGLSVIEEIW